MIRTRAAPVKAHPDSIRWLPAERLGQLSVDSQVRPWLIGKGLLTQRLKAVCGERFGLRLVDQWTAVLGAAYQTALRSTDNAGLFRDVEMSNNNSVWVFEQAVMPDSTLVAHPWLAELGDSALGETLSDLSGVERSSYEYAWLPAGEAVTARALRDAQVKPAGLWARRSRLSLRSAPLLIQELFFPSMGHV
ncbi:MAG: chorismate lyase [Gammaproteobacteria bacterium]